jgi:Ca2+-binding RTX toxin-like protein
VDSAADTLIGGNGDDVYHLDHPGDASDTIIEYANEGLDLVTTSFDYTLGANLEHLRLNFFAGAINGTGNELDNTIDGSGSDNVIDGRAGVDTLIGHHGNDTYIVDNAGDVVIEAVGQGALDRVRTSVTYVLGAGAEAEVLETTDPAGTAALDLVQCVRPNHLRQQRQQHHRRRHGPRYHDWKRKRRRLRVDVDRRHRRCRQ